MNITTSYQLIEYIVQNDLHIKYANFLYLKTLYSNSCIYSYSVKKLACKSSKSRTFIKQNVAYFLKHDWCRLHGDNLIFNSHKYLNNLYGIKHKRLCILRFKNLESLRTEIYGKLMFDKEKQVKYLISMKHDLTTPRTLKAHKRARSYFRGESVEINEKFTISFEGLSRLFNCSKSMAFRIISKLIKAKRLKKQKNVILILKGVTKKFFQSLCLDNSYFIFNSMLFKVGTNNYSVLLVDSQKEHPLKTK